MLRHVWPVNSDNSFNAISFPEAAILLPVQVDKATRTLGTRLLSTFLVDPDEDCDKVNSVCKFFSWNFTTKDETCEVHFQEGDYELNLECLFAI